MNYVILIVDDDAEDSEFIKSALSTKLPTNSVETFANGRELFARLSEPHRPVPHLIVLDIVMPLMDGFEVLAQLRKDAALSRIPVVVWSDSMYAGRTISLGAIEQYEKPTTYAQYEDIADKILERLEVHEYESA